MLEGPPFDAATDAPTLWGLTAAQLHDRYWASRGAQVVRQGERSEIDLRADVFLLTDRDVLALFSLPRLAQELYWDNASVVCVRLHERNGRRNGARVFLTCGPDLAKLWQQSPSPRDGRRQLRGATARQDRIVDSAPAGIYDRHDKDEVMQFMRRLAREWKNPAVAIGRPLRQVSTAWVDPDSKIGRSVKFVGPVWIGTGLKLEDDCTVRGPEVLWDVASDFDPENPS